MHGQAIPDSRESFDDLESYLASKKQVEQPAYAAMEEAQSQPARQISHHPRSTIDDLDFFLAKNKKEEPEP